jgi:signal transduction histidine kinase
MEKQMETNLYETIIKNSPIACSVVKLVREKGEISDFTTIEVNDAFEIETGISVVDVINKRITEVLPKITNNEVDIFGIINKVYREESKTNFVFYVSDIHKWFRIHFVYYNEDYMTTYLKNITKDYEESLKKRAELMDAVKMAEEANTVKTRFLANVSHEIRTPLHGILGFLSLLGTTPINNEQKEYMKYISMATERLQTTMNNILDMANIESKEIKLEGLEFNLRYLMEELLIKYEKSAREKGIVVIYNCCREKNCNFVGDDEKLKMVFSNIIDNSIKFTEEGVVKVDIEIFPLNEVQSEIAVSFLDTGIGMIEDDLKVIFKPFVQLDATSTRNYGGSGIGLYIVKKTVDAMEGKINVKSNLGTGTEFEVRLILDQA